MRYREIESIEALIGVLKAEQTLYRYAFQNLDFECVMGYLEGRSFNDCIFMGCRVPEKMKGMMNGECLEFPMIEKPFNPFINSLYSKETLLGAYRPGAPESYEETHDKLVYDHFIKQGKEAGDIKETLARRLHDHSVTDALYDFLSGFEERKVIAIMGGHSLGRDNRNYLEIALISKKLSENGYLLVSGGGPGAMEATHVGAWMAGRGDAELHSVIEILSEAPGYKDKLWFDKAFQVIEKFPHSGSKSLGIPTWLYGHEPPTPFATHIAKYFANSVREDGLLAIAKGGVIFAPGNAGTVQEIFQDATQNNYLSFGYSSPMVFFNSNYWSREYPVFPLLLRLSLEGKYHNLILSICDTCDEVVREIKKFTGHPRK